MKKIFHCLFAAGLCFISVIAKAQTTSTGSAVKSKANTSIDGAWRSVEGNEFMLMSDGYFSSIALDSTGKCPETYAGWYSAENANSITLKVYQSSVAYRIGYLHTIEYDIKDDKLTITWFKKLVDSKSVDVTSKVPQGVQAQYTRFK